MDNDKQILVGIGVMVIKDGKVLAGKRKGSFAPGKYSWPGGKMHYMESFEDCARREVREETGIEIENVRFLRLMNFKDHAPKHFVDIGLVADWKSGEPKVMEPDKCEGWNWYDIDNLPEPLFECEYSDIEAYKTGKNFYDA